MNEGKRIPPPIKMPDPDSQEYQQRLSSQKLDMFKAMEMFGEAMDMVAQKKDKRALSIFHRILQSFKDHVPTLIQIGLINIRKKDYKKAKTYFYKALENKEIDRKSKNIAKEWIVVCDQNITNKL